MQKLRLSAGNNEFHACWIATPQAGSSSCSKRNWNIGVFNNLSCTFCNWLLEKHCPLHYRTIGSRQPWNWRWKLGSFHILQILKTWLKVPTFNLCRNLCRFRADGEPGSSERWTSYTGIPRKNFIPLLLRWWVEQKYHCMAGWKDYMGIL